MFGFFVLPTWHCHFEILNMFLFYSQIFYRLKFEKKLTNSAMPSVLGRVMDAVNFTGIYITQKTLNLVYERLPHLQALSLKECSYLITDNVLCKLVKVSCNNDNLYSIIIGLCGLTFSLSICNCSSFHQCASVCPQYERLQFCILYLLEWKPPLNKSHS